MFGEQSENNSLHITYSSFRYCYQLNQISLNKFYWNW